MYDKSCSWSSGADQRVRSWRRTGRCGCSAPLGFLGSLAQSSRELRGSLDRRQFGLKRRSGWLRLCECLETFRDLAGNQVAFGHIAQIIRPHREDI